MSEHRTAMRHDRRTPGFISSGLIIMETTLLQPAGTQTDRNSRELAGCNRLQ